MNVLELHERTEEPERGNCQKISTKVPGHTQEPAPHRLTLRIKTARHTAGREMARSEQKPEQL